MPPLKSLVVILVLVSTQQDLPAATAHRDAVVNHDKRRENQTPARALDANRQAALTRLEARIPGTKIDIDEISGSPKLIFNTDGFLTGPESEDEILHPRKLGEGPPQPGEPSDPQRRLKQFLDENAALFGHRSDILTNARVSREYVTAHNGLRTIVWQQQLDDIPVFEAVLYGHITKNGELVSLCSQFLPSLTTAADAGVPNRLMVQAVPSISPQQAVAYAATNIGEVLEPVEVFAKELEPQGAERLQRFEASALRGEAKASLVWLPMNRDTMRLCWRVILTGKTRGEMFQVLVDCETGEALVRHSWTFNAQTNSFFVYTSDSPSPLSPGYSWGSTNITNQPATINQMLVVLTALSTNASPDGWVTTNSSVVVRVNRTIGNNVDAHLDVNDLNPAYDAPITDPDEARPLGTNAGGVLRYWFTNDVSIAPTEMNQPATATTNQRAAVVHAFYWGNWMHDRLYDLGFTEAAGNAQRTNYGRGGVGNDAFLFDVHNHAKTGAGGAPACGANGICPPVDGDVPTISFALLPGPIPDRDGALDTEVLLHEYTHLLSNRRVGQGVGLNNDYARSLAEGWSDFYPLALLAEPGDDPGGTYAWGAYLAYLYPPLTYSPTNYYFGLTRRYPYSTNLLINPLTLRHIDDDEEKAAVPTNVPIKGENHWDEHSRGQLWAVTLWEARARLIVRHGFTNGNELTLRLVTDGMGLCPPNPTFLQARDALMLADRVNTGGANLNDLWFAFARRGMGWYATNFPLSPIFPYLTVEEDFSLPPTGTNYFWSYATSNEVTSTPALGLDGTVYVGSYDGNLYAITNGGVKWAFGPATTYPRFRCAPSVGPDGTIYSRRNDGYLYAINPDGTQKWSKQIYYDTDASPAVGLDGTIYVPGTTNLVAVNPDGSQKWSVPASNTVYSSPAVAPDGTIYFGGMDGRVYAVETNGSGKGGSWPYQTSNSVVSSPAIGPDLTIYVGSWDSNLYALYPAGTKQWSRPTGGKITSSPAVGPDGRIYVGSDDYRLYCFNADGTTNWSRPTGFRVSSSPAVAADGTVYVGSQDAKIYAFNSDGTTNWSWYTGGSIYSSPCIGPDGTVYIGSINYKVYAFRGVSGPALSAWPGFRRDARHVANLGNITLRPIDRWTNGAFHFEAYANPGLSSVQLEASSDLANWGASTPVTLTGGAGSFVDIGASAFSNRFYRASSGSYRSMNPAGFVTLALPSGNSLVANPLQATNFAVSALFASLTNNGTMVLKYQPGTGGYDVAVLTNGVWTGNAVTLAPGEGVILSNTAPATVAVTLKGEVMQGWLWNPVPVLSLRSSMVRQAGGIQSDLGFQPTDGDTVLTLSTNGWTPFTYDLGLGGWDPAEPALQAGECCWIGTSSPTNWVRTFSVW